MSLTNRSKPNSPNTLDILKFINKIKEIGIKAILLDFDYTILRIHATREMERGFKTPEEFTKERDLSVDFADLELFKNLVQTAQKEGLDVWIVSFGDRELIEQYIKYAGVQVYISTLADIDHYDVLEDSPYGKNPQIFQILEEIEGKQEPNQLLLIDDDHVNCEMAKVIETNVFNVSQTGLTASEFERLTNIYINLN